MRLIYFGLVLVLGCGGQQQEPAAPAPQVQAEIEETRAAIAKTKREISTLKRSQSSELNTDALFSIYEAELVPEHYAEYWRSGQDFARRARQLEGVLLYRLVKHPKKPNTVVWMERFSNQEAKENYRASSGVKEAQAKTKHMVKNFSYTLIDAKERMQ